MSVETRDSELPTVRPSRSQKVLGRRSGRLQHAIQEITFIVIGVLIALAANSWWEDRHDRERERLNLGLLDAATAANLARVNEAIAGDSTSLAMAERALAAARTPIPFPDSVSDWLYRSTYFSDFHPLTGTYTALANNAELNLIRNDDVRAAVVTMAGELAGVEQQIRIYDAVAMSNAAMLFRFFDAVTAAVRAHPEWFAFADDLAPRAAPVRRAPTRGSPELEHALFMTWINAGNRIEILDRLRRDLASLQGALAGELAR